MLQNVLLISLSASPVIGLMILLGPALRKRYAMRRMYLAWLIIAVRLLIPWRPEISRAPVQIPLPPAVAAPEALRPGVTPEETPAAGGVSPAALAYGLWVLGAAAVLGYHGSAYFRFRRRIRPFLREVSPPLSREPGVYRCGCVAGPMMLGYLRPMILLPEVEYTPEELDAVLTHERAHFRRGDVWYKLVLLLACAAHWFNPLVWLMLRRAGRDLEFACDEQIIARRGSEYRIPYSEAILKSAERSEP